MFENSGAVDVVGGDCDVVGGDCVGDGGGGRYKCEPLSQAIQAPGASKAELAHASPYHADRVSSSTISTPATPPWHPHHADQPASSPASF